jgi:hypothetical protein
MTGVTERELPAAISHAEMNAACDRGDAAPLAPAISWLTRYQDTWWVVYEGGWLRITDELTEADIDDCAARLTTGTAARLTTGTKEESCPPPH